MSEIPYYILLCCTAVSIVFHWIFYEFHRALLRFHLFYISVVAEILFLQLTFTRLYYSKIHICEYYRRSWWPSDASFYTSNLITHLLWSNLPCMSYPNVQISAAKLIPELSNKSWRHNYCRNLLVCIKCFAADFGTLNNVEIYLTARI